jgi:PAS domain S-box-containing protein
MMELGQVCARALERASSFAVEASERGQLRELNVLGAALARAPTLGDVAQVIVQFGVERAMANTCALYVSISEPSELELVASSGTGAEVIGSIKRIDARQTAMAYATVDVEQSRWIPLNEEHRALTPVLSALSPAALQAKAFWTLPLVVGGRSIGLLAMAFGEVRRFTESERLFPETFARLAAEALCRVLETEAEAQARRFAERTRTTLQTTLGSIGEAVIAADTNDRVTFMNPVAEDLTGWPAVEALARSLSEVLHVIDEVRSPRDESPGVDELRNTSKTALLVSRDGTRVVPIGVSEAFMRGEDGSSQGHVIVFRDVSANRTAELRSRFISEVTRALRESLDYRSTLADVARLAVPRIADWVAVDLLEDGKGEANRVAVTHIESGNSELQPKSDDRPCIEGLSLPVSAGVMRTGRSLLCEDVQSKISGGSSGDEEPFPNRGIRGVRSLMIVPLIARGQTLGAMSFATAVTNRTYGPADLAVAEELCGLCALAIDNAHLRSAQQSAQRSAELANTAKDEFLATVSHELRTPLNAIMGWARLLSSPDLDATRRRRGIETIERNSVAMARLIEDILDVSRIISGKMRLELKVVNLPQVIEAAIESVRPAAEAKSLTIAASLDRSCCPILGDPARIQQVIWNLLSNAVKFNTSAGRVEVGLRQSDSTIEIRIADTGRGIHPNFLPYVFDPFRQAESGYARGRSGLGLGLAIARQLTELHGGLIDVASEGEGCGATFWVRLPVPAISRAGEPQSAPAHRRIASQPKFESLGILRGLNVLVVDDDEDARILVKTVLEQCGSLVRTSASVAEGIAEISRECPKLVISDIGMPGEDGYDLIRRIRNSGDPRIATLPAAALTAFVRTEDRQRMLRAGYGTHIPKPVEPAELVSAIARLLRISAAEGRTDHGTGDTHSVDS